MTSSISSRPLAIRRISSYRRISYLDTQKFDQHLVRPAQGYPHGLELASSTRYVDEPAVFGPPRKSRNSGSWSISWVMTGILAGLNRSIFQPLTHIYPEDLILDT